MLNAIIEEWIQILRNHDLISWPQMDEVLKKMYEGEYKKVKEAVKNFIRNNSEEKYETAQKLYSYIEENYLKGNTNLCYKEILSDVI